MLKYQFVCLFILHVVVCQNETIQIETSTDLVSSGAGFSRNLTTTIAIVEDLANSSTNTSGKIESRSTNETTPKTYGDFKPSPGIYEYNKFPVKPAHPEPKIRYGNIVAETNSERQKESATWRVGNDPVETKVRFPYRPTDSPYPFELKPCCQGQEKIVDRNTDPSNSQRAYLPHGGYPYPTFSSSGAGKDFNFNQLVEPHKGYYYPPQKEYDFGYNLMEKPSYEVRPHNYDNEGNNPWKKILKLLASFIPIGILISALTPTVITVTSVNDTTDNMEQSRYRSQEDPKAQLQNHILKSLKYFDDLNAQGCQYKVFCELLVTANQLPDSERHVQSLFDNFAKNQGYQNNAKELEKVFQAVRARDCDPIECETRNQT